MKKEVLIVKPTYREDWLLPGGIVEQDESPRQACIREINEELSLTIPITQLLCIEYHSNDDRQTESVQFVFYGCHLEESQLPAIKLQEAELSSYCFASSEDAQQLLSYKLAKRLPYCLQALDKNIALYLEDGKLLA